MAQQGAAATETTRHNAAISRMIEHAEVLLFTAGLSEVWENAEDRLAFIMAPPAPLLDRDRHAFRVLCPEENQRNIEYFVETARSINPDLQIIVALPPVPLRATFRDDANELVADE